MQNAPVGKEAIHATRVQQFVIYVWHKTYLSNTSLQHIADFKIYKLHLRDDFKISMYADVGRYRELMQKWGFNQDAHTECDPQMMKLECPLLPEPNSRDDLAGDTVATREEACMMLSETVNLSFMNPIFV